MQRFLHLFQPIQDIFAPLGIVSLPGVALRPLTVYIHAAGAKQVLQADIVRRDTVVPTLSGGYRIGLYLPGYQSGSGKIEGHIGIAKFIGRSHAITLGQYPIWMNSLPIGEIMPRPEAREGPPITMKGNIVGQEHSGVNRTILFHMIELGTPDSIIVFCHRGRIGNLVIEHLKDVDVVPGINKGAYPWNPARAAIAYHWRRPGVCATIEKKEQE